MRTSRIQKVVAALTATLGLALVMASAPVVVKSDADCRTTTQVSATGEIACGVATCDMPANTCDETSWVAPDDTRISFCNCGNWDPGDNPFTPTGDDPPAVCHAFGRKSVGSSIFRACMPDTSCGDPMLECEVVDPTLFFQQCKCGGN